jgi:hypothetical protein
LFLRGNISQQSGVASGWGYILKISDVFAMWTPWCHYSHLHVQHPTPLGCGGQPVAPRLQPVQHVTAEYCGQLQHSASICVCRLGKGTVKIWYQKRSGSHAGHVPWPRPPQGGTPWCPSSPQQL